MYSHSAFLNIYCQKSIKMVSSFCEFALFSQWITYEYVKEQKSQPHPFVALLVNSLHKKKKIHLCFVFVFLIWLLIQKRHSPLFYHTSSLLWEFSVRDLAQVLVLKCFLTDWQIAYNNAGISAFSYLNLSAFFRSCFSVFPFYHETNMQD